MGRLVYQVHDRRLEQFLFSHDIFFVSTHRTEDGCTVWEYEDNDYFRSVLMEWRDVLARRAARKKKERMKGGSV